MDHPTWSVLCFRQETDSFLVAVKSERPTWPECVFSKKLQTLFYGPIDGPSNVICTVFSARRWLASPVPVSCTVKHDLYCVFSKNTVFWVRRWLPIPVSDSCAIKHDLYCVSSKNTVFWVRRWLASLVPVGCIVKHDLCCVFSKLCFQQGYCVFSKKLTPYPGFR